MSFKNKLVLSKNIGSNISSPLCSSRILSLTIRGLTLFPFPSNLGELGQWRCCCLARLYTVHGSIPTSSWDAAPEPSFYTVRCHSQGLTAAGVVPYTRGSELQVAPVPPSGLPAAPSSSWDKDKPPHCAHRVHGLNGPHVTECYTVT